MSIAVFTRAPCPESRFESGSQSTRERWSESGFESTFLCVNATSLDQDLDQNARVNGAYVTNILLVKGCTCAVVARGVARIFQGGFSFRKFC